MAKNPLARLSSHALRITDNIWEPNNVARRTLARFSSIRSPRSWNTWIWIVEMMRNGCQIKSTVAKYDLHQPDDLNRLRVNFRRDIFTQSGAERKRKRQIAIQVHRFSFDSSKCSSSPNLLPLLLRHRRSFSVFHLSARYRGPATTAPAPPPSQKYAIFARRIPASAFHPSVRTHLLTIFSNSVKCATNIRLSGTTESLLPINSCEQREHDSGSFWRASRLHRITCERQTVSVANERERTCVTVQRANVTVSIRFDYFIDQPSFIDSSFVSTYFIKFCFRSCSSEWPKKKFLLEDEHIFWSDWSEVTRREMGQIERFLLVKCFLLVFLGAEVSVWKIILQTNEENGKFNYILLLQ